jgi:hypothetical protein
MARLLMSAKNSTNWYGSFWVSLPESAAARTRQEQTLRDACREQAAAAAAELTLHTAHGAHAQSEPPSLAAACLPDAKVKVHRVTLRPPEHRCLARLEYQTALVGQRVVPQCLLEERAVHR